MWVCFKCGQEIEDQFDACWNCAMPPDQRVRPPAASRQWQKAFTFGLLFEVILVLLCALLPKGSWLFTQAYEFLLLSHHPLIWLSSRAPGLTLIILVTGGLVMTLVWAFLFRRIWALATWLLARFQKDACRDAGAPSQQ